MTIVLSVACIVLSGGCDASHEKSIESPTITTPKPPPPLPPDLMRLVQLDARGQHATARTLAEKYLLTHPNDGRAEFIIGLTFFNQDNHGAAKPHFAKALHLSPGYWVTHHYFGQSLFLLGDLDGAREQHEAHLKVDPAATDALYGIGLVDLEESQLDEAERRFRRAIELYELLKRRDPKRFAASRAGLARCHARLADVYFARDEYEAARDELLTSTEIEPRNISAFYTLSQVYRRLGEDNLADDALRRYESARDVIISGQRRGE